MPSSSRHGAVDKKKNNFNPPKKGGFFYFMPVENNGHPNRPSLPVLGQVISYLGIDWGLIQETTGLEPVAELVYVMARGLETGMSSLPQIGEEAKMLSNHPVFGPLLVAAHFAPETFSSDTIPVEPHDPYSPREASKRDALLFEALERVPGGFYVSCSVQETVDQMSHLLGTDMIHASDLVQPKVDQDGVRGITFMGAHIISKHARLHPGLDVGLNLMVREVETTNGDMLRAMDHLVDPLMQLEATARRHGLDTLHTCVVLPTRMKVDRYFAPLRASR